MASNGISIKELTKTKDHSSLERETAKDTTFQQTLSSDRDCPDLPHLVATVRHLLVGHTGHLQTQLLDQSEVNHGRTGRG